MHAASLLFVFLSFGLNGLVEKPPYDLVSLLEPQTALMQLNQDYSEEALLKLISEKHLTEVAEDRLKQAGINLGNESFKIRRQAKRLLRVAGEPAIPYLEEAIRSEDPEIRVSAQEILTEIRDEMKNNANEGDLEYVKKLLAIRMLAEKKSTQALPFLETLSKTGSPTLADEATRAIAVIKGELVTRPDVKPLLDELVQRIPAETASAGLLDLSTGATERTLASFVNELIKKPETAEFAGLLGPALSQDRHTKELIKSLGVMGNLRLDAAAMIISNDIGVDKQSGHLGFIFKGLCEKAMLEQVFAKEFRKSYKLDGATVYYQSDLAICCPDSKTLIVGISDRNDGRQIDPLIKAYAGKLEKVNKDVLSTRHPIIVPGLQPVLDGKARISIAGAASAKQQEAFNEAIAPDLNRLKKRAAGPNARPRHKSRLAIMVLSQKLMKAKSLQSHLESDTTILLSATLEKEADATEMKTLLLELDKQMREEINQKLEQGRGGIMLPGFNKLLGDLAVPSLTITQKKNTLEVRAPLERIITLMTVM